MQTFRGPVFRIVIGMLEGDDLLLLRIVVCIAMHGSVEDRLHPGQPESVVDLHLRHQVVALVEGADCDIEAGRRTIGQRRAAFRAKAAVDINRGLEVFRLPAGPLDPTLSTVLRRCNKRPEETAERLLAHPAMADGGTTEL